MKKLLIGTALILTALPFTFDGVTPAVSTAHAIIGRPLTPLFPGTSPFPAAASARAWRHDDRSLWEDGPTQSAPPR